LEFYQVIDRFTISDFQDEIKLHEFRFKVSFSSILIFQVHHQKFDLFY
jgi:hypothetical protein